MPGWDDQGQGGCGGRRDSKQRSSLGKGTELSRCWKTWGALSGLRTGMGGDGRRGLEADAHV